MRLSHAFLAALAGPALGGLVAVAGPVPPPPPGQVPLPGMTPPPLPPAAPPPAPPLTDPQLRVAATALNDLEALVTELRNTDDRTVTAGMLDDVTREIAVRRADLRRQAVQVSAGSDADAARMARSVTRWVSEAGKPLHQARMARLRAEAGQVRQTAEQEYARLATFLSAEDPFPGEAEFTHRQAAAYWDEGNVVAAAATYERLRVLTAAALEDCGRRREARQARREAETACGQAALVHAEQYAVASHQRGANLAAAAESAFARGEYPDARSNWNQAALCYEHATDLAAPLMHLARARARYDALSRGLTPGDREAVAGDSSSIAHCLSSAVDDRVEPAARTAGYEQAARLLVPVQLRTAHALQERQPDAALDHLATVLHAFPNDPDARTLFDSLADRPSWWLAQARSESLQVHHPHDRLTLYPLLARARRSLGDQAGAERARSAGVALVQQQVGEAWVPPPVFDLLAECLEAKDEESFRAVLAASRQLAPPTTDPWRRALWLTRLAGYASRAGETATAEALVSEASALLPGHAPWVTALAASTAGRHAEALQQWRELARLAKEPARKVARMTVVDLGSRVLETAAEGGDADTVRVARDELLALVEKEDEAMKARVRRPLALADAYQGRWELVAERSSEFASPQGLSTLARIRVRQGEIGAAVDLLESAASPEAVACYQVAVAMAGGPGERTDLLEWIGTLPEPELRCAACLGVAEGLGAARKSRDKK